MVANGRTCRMEGAHAKVIAKDSNISSIMYLVLVVPARYMAHIFSWLFIGGSLTLIEFFSKKEDLLNKFKPFEQKKILDGTDPTEMDVSLLYQLLFHACKIPREPPWDCPVKAGRQPSLGQILYQVKEVRNFNVHNPATLIKVTDDDLDELAKKQKCRLTQMLTLAGRRARKSRDTINATVSSMEADLDQRDITVKDFVSRANLELSQNKNNQNCSSLNYVEPLLVVNTRDALMDSEVRLRDLFSLTFQDGSLPQVIHVTGEAGAGKTSLCQ